MAYPEDLWQDYPEPSIDTTINLNDQGLSDGDDIDSYFDSYLGEGVRLEIEPGTYSFDGSGLNRTLQNAEIVGLTESDVPGEDVVLQGTHGGTNFRANGSGDCVRFRNFTVRGHFTDNFRLDATHPDATIVCERVHLENTADPQDANGFFVGGTPSNTTHYGELRLLWCSARTFADNGAYVDGPAPSDSTGRVVVVGGYYRSNNVSNVRVGTPYSDVYGVTIYTTGSEVPEHATSFSGVNSRGIVLRQWGHSIHINECDLHYESDAGGSGCLIWYNAGVDSSGVMENIRLRNHSSVDAVHADDPSKVDSNWTLRNIHLTGTGDLTSPLTLEDSPSPNSSAAEEPDLDPWWGVEELSLGPPRPTNLTVASRDSSSITVDWDAPDHDDIDHYAVYVDGSQDQTVDHPTTDATITGLSAGTTYTIGVATVDSEGEESSASEIDVSTTDVDAPSNLTFPDEGEYYIDLDWDAPGDTSNVDHYRVYVDDIPETTTADASTTSASVSDLSPGSTYGFGVVSVDADGNESDAVEASHATDPLPKPQNLEVTNTSTTSITLDWDAPDVYPTEGLTQYNVYVDGSLTEEVPESETSVRLTDLDPGTIYQVGVATVDGLGSVSDTVTELTATASLDAPRNLTLTDVGGSSVGLKWDPPEDPDFEIDSYHVYVNGGHDHAVGADTTSTSVTGLSLDTTYTFGVTAADSDGNESSTTELVASTESLTPPQNLVPSRVESTLVELDWDPPEEQGAGLDRYRVYRDGSHVETVPHPTTAAEVRELSPETQYTLAVDAVDSEDNVSDKTSLTATTGSLGQPRNVQTLTARTRSIDVAWSEPEEFDGEVGGYRVYVDGEQHTDVGASARQATVDGLSPNNDYTIGVAALDVGGGASAPVEIIGQTEPIEPPGNLSILAEFNTSVRIGWTRPETSDYDIDRFRIYVNGTQWQLAEASDTQADVTGLEPETEYAISIATVDTEFFESEEAGPVFAFTSAEGSNHGGTVLDPDDPSCDFGVRIGDDPDDGDEEPEDLGPGTPQNFQKGRDANHEEIDLEWDEPDDPGQGIVGYDIYIDGEFVEDSENTIEALDTPPSVPGSVATFEVVAVDEHQNESDPASFELYIPESADEGPSEPLNLTQTSQPPDPTIEWDPPTEAGVREVQKYDIYFGNKADPDDFLAEAVYAQTDGATSYTFDSSEYDTDEINVAVVAVDDAGYESDYSDHIVLQLN